MGVQQLIETSRIRRRTQPVRSRDEQYNLRILFVRRLSSTWFAQFPSARQYGLQSQRGKSERSAIEGLACHRSERRWGATGMTAHRYPDQNFRRRFGAPGERQPERTHGGLSAALGGDLKAQAGAAGERLLSALAMPPPSCSRGAVAVA